MQAIVDDDYSDLEDEWFESIKVRLRYGYHRSKMDFTLEI